MIRMCRPEAIAAGRRACHWILALLFAALIHPAAWGGAEQEVYITHDNTPLFAAPAEDAEVVLRANAGHRLFVRERAGDWLKVFTPQYMLVGEEMWVKADLVGPPPARTRPLPAPTADAAGPAMAPVFHLDVGGTPGLDMIASCRVVEAEGGPRRLRERSALVPVAYAFIGSALSCIVQKRDDFGRLEVALRGPDGALIATAETAAPFGSVRVRSAGPWGDADASRGPSAIFLLPDDFRFRFARPPARIPVPPFRSPPVPPLSGFPAPLWPRSGDAGGTLELPVPQDRQGQFSIDRSTPNTSMPASLEKKVPAAGPASARALPTSSTGATTQQILYDDKNEGIAIMRRSRLTTAETALSGEGLRLISA